MPQALDKGYDLDAEFLGRVAETINFLEAVSRLAAETLVHLPGKGVLPLDQHGVVAGGGEHLQ